MNELNKTDFNFNYICLTAYRTLLLLKYLMAKNTSYNCQHLILDNYYCSKCGTLYYRGVSKIFII